MRAVVLRLVVLQGAASLSGCTAPASTAEGAQAIRVNVEVTASGDFTLRITAPDGDELLREEREWSSAQTFPFEAEVQEQGGHSVRLAVTRQLSGGVNSQHHTAPAETRQCARGEVLVLHEYTAREPGLRVVGCEAA